MTASAKRKPAQSTQGLSPELRKALKFRERPWSPPKALSFSVLKQVPRPPLMDVLNLLAFGKPAPPKEMSPLTRNAHWDRALKALCAAARDGKVKLLGRPGAEGPSQAIDPTEFDSPLALDDEQGTIGIDLGALTGEQFARAWDENRLWRDARVDRESLVSWVQGLDMAPANAAPKAGPRSGRPSSMYAIEAELDRWIAGKIVLEQMRHWAPMGRDIRSKGRVALALSRWSEKAGGATAPSTIEKALPEKLNKALAAIK